VKAKEIHKLLMENQYNYTITSEYLKIDSTNKQKIKPHVAGSILAVDGLNLDLDKP
jgi:hypothetical protein